MNSAIEYRSFENYVRVTHCGEYTVRDCNASKTAYLSLPFWKPGMNLLVDYRQATFGFISLEELRQGIDFHAAHKELIGDGRMAFLMGSTRDFGIARQYELATEALVYSKMMAFLDEKKAVEWVSNAPERRAETLTIESILPGFTPVVQPHK